MSDRVALEAVGARARVVWRVEEGVEDVSLEGRRVRPVLAQHLECVRCEAFALLGEVPRAVVGSAWGKEEPGALVFLVRDLLALALRGLAV